MSNAISFSLWMIFGLFVLLPLMVLGVVLIILGVTSNIWYIPLSLIVVGFTFWLGYVVCDKLTDI